MSLDHPVLLTAVGLIVLVIVGALVSHFFSPAARLERRRRRNNYRVVSKVRRPMVTLRLRTGKK